MSEPNGTEVPRGAPALKYAHKWRDFAVYIHIPYCTTKCPYCDFNSYRAKKWPEEEYVQALLRELRHYVDVPPFRGGRVRSIFFGGGTPTLFHPRSLGRVIDRVAHLWPLRHDLEVTVEANPGTVDNVKLRDLRNLGVNRLSFGAQSFHPELLEELKRDHSVDETLDSVWRAFFVGFDNINVDLMYAIPKETPFEALRDAKLAASLPVTHISAYALTYSRATQFYKWLKSGWITPVSEKAEIRMNGVIGDVLRDAGFERYEVSNYAKPGYASRHNLTYWRVEPYLGVGAGAHGFAYPGGKHGFGWRWANQEVPEHYMALVRRKGHARALVEQLTATQSRDEYFMLRLRCREGLNIADYRARYGSNPEEDFPGMLALRQTGHLETDGEFWRIPEQGMFVTDEIVARIR